MATPFYFSLRVHELAAQLEQRQKVKATLTELLELQEELPLIVLQMYRIKELALLLKGPAWKLAERLARGIESKEESIGLPAELRVVDKENRKRRCSDQSGSEPKRLKFNFQEHLQMVLEQQSGQELLDFATSNPAYQEKLEPFFRKRLLVEFNESEKPESSTWQIHYRTVMELEQKEIRKRVEGEKKREQVRVREQRRRAQFRRRMFKRACQLV